MVLWNYEEREIMMNHQLQAFARQRITEDWEEYIKILKRNNRENEELLYSFKRKCAGNIVSPAYINDMSIKDAVQKIPDVKLDWEMCEIENALFIIKNLGRNKE
jgi:hypothetical protein